MGNESDTDVFFDDVRVEHRPGLLVQETEYDPFGLELASLNRPAPGLKLLNQYKYNGTEHQPDLDLGLNVDLALYRTLDRQLGRWWQVDPVTEGFESWTPYNLNFDNPVRYADPNGDCPLSVTAGISALVGGAISAGLAFSEGKSTDEVLTAATAGAVGGVIAGSGVGLIAELGVGVAGAITINASAGFVAGTAEEATSQGIQVGTGRAAGFHTGKIATNAMVGAASNVVGGAFGEYVVEPGVKRVAAKVAASTAARTAGPEAQRGVRASLVQADKSLRNNNQRLNAAVGSVVKTRRQEAASLEKFVEKKAGTGAQVAVETTAQKAENSANDQANKRNRRE